jgi:hypothetical protein
MTSLIEHNDCIFDKDQLVHSFGYASLDPVGQEAFVNHVHFSGTNFRELSQVLISTWENEMKTKWSHFVFRIYLQEEADEHIVRFHRVRMGIPDWCKDGVQGVVIKIVGDR